MTSPSRASKISLGPRTLSELGPSSRPTKCIHLVLWEVLATLFEDMLRHLCGVLKVWAPDRQWQHPCEGACSKCIFPGLASLPAASNPKVWGSSGAQP